jgi:hypothetical protein
MPHTSPLAGPPSLPPLVPLLAVHHIRRCPAQSRPSMPSFSACELRSRCWRKDWTDELTHTSRVLLGRAAPFAEDSALAQPPARATATTGRAASALHRRVERSPDRDAVGRCFPVMIYCSCRRRQPPLIKLINQNTSFIYITWSGCVNPSTS